MKKTPDHVSKKKQVVSTQIRAWKSKLNEIKQFKSITYEEQAEKSRQISFIEDQLLELYQTMRHLNDQSKPGNFYIKGFGRA